MTRLLSLLAFGALAAALFLLPEPDPNRLAAVDMGSLLSEPVKRGAGAEGEGTPLWSALLERLEAEPRTDAEAPPHIAFGGARMTAPGSVVRDPNLHLELRRSLRRAMRAILAEEGLSHGLAAGGKGEMPEEGGTEVLGIRVAGGLELRLTTPDGEVLIAEKEWHNPARSSLYPPLVAILLAILFRQPVLALFVGVLSGAFLAAFGTGAGARGAGRRALTGTFTTYFWNEFTDRDRILIVLFVVFMLAMVGVMTRSGGIRGVMDKIAGLASDARRTQIATWFMGLAVFFDDYANTILVGSTMRPLSDRFKVAREKLAYIVDSTAAPVAGLSIFSTWIAFEVSTFSAQLPDVGMTANDGYRIFLETLPFRFYCIFTLIFVAMIVFTGRDMGPMLEAERRARKGQVIREGGTPLVGKQATSLEPMAGVVPSASRALLPIVTFIVVTLTWLGWKGGALDLGLEVLSLEGLAIVLYNGDSFQALMAGSLAGFLIAVLAAILGGSGREVPSASWSAVRSMGVALVILYLAWMIGAVCGDLGTAPYLTVLVGDSLNPLLLPVILFALSGVVAFSTGSSWSTMTILLPIVVSLAYQLGQTIPIGGNALMILSIGAVLEGAIFGDHCSPISDTTVMSSIACASDHIDHVRTQAPYALLTMAVAVVCGYIPCTFLDLSPWLAIGLGTAAMFVVLRWRGRRAADLEAAGT